MEDTFEKTGKFTLVPPFISLSSDKDNTNSEEASGTEDICKIIQLQHYESSQTHILTDDSDCQTEELCSLIVQSWASEMSSLDKWTSQKSMWGIEYPCTPPLVLTPTEFKDINWKKLVEDTSTSDLNLSPRADINSGWNKVLVEELEDDNRERDEGERASNSNSNSCASINDSVETPGRFVFAEGEPSLCSKTPSQRSDQECTNSPGEPVFDQPVFDQQNLIVNYLPPDMNSTMLLKLFSPYGTIVSCKVVVDRASGLSKGYGFVKFQTAEEGCRAQAALHQYQAGRKTLKVFLSRQPQSGEKSKHHTNLYLSNLDPRHRTLIWSETSKRVDTLYSVRFWKMLTACPKELGLSGLIMPTAHSELFNGFMDRNWMGQTGPSKYVLQVLRAHLQGGSQFLKIHLPPHSQPLIDQFIKRALLAMLQAFMYRYQRKL